MYLSLSDQGTSSGPEESFLQRNAKRVKFFGLTAVTLLILFGLFWPRDEAAPAGSFSLANPFAYSSAIDESVTWSDEGCREVIDAQQVVIKDLWRKALEGHNHAVMLAFPDHMNKGDSAIWVGEQILLASLGVKVVYATNNNVDQARVRRLAREYPDLVVIMHGGGNFGDLYPVQMTAHLNAVKWFHDIPVRFMPQSIHFGKPDRIPETAEVLSGHPDLQLYVRDQPSLELALEHFGSKGVPVHLSPDMAFMMGDQSDIRRSVTPSHDLLVFAREDIEGHHWNTTAAKPDGVSIIQGDWASSNYWLAKPLPKDFNVLAYKRTMIGYNFLRQGELVIMDRLHGHILSILLGIPSILIDNNVGKLSKYRNTWTQTCKLTKVALSAEEAKSMAESFFANGRAVQRKTLPFEPVVPDSSADDEEKRTA